MPTAPYFPGYRPPAFALEAGDACVVKAFEPQGPYGLEVLIHQVEFPVTAFTAVVLDQSAAVTLTLGMAGGKWLEQVAPTFHQVCHALAQGLLRMVPAPRAQPVQATLFPAANELCRDVRLGVSASGNALLELCATEAVDDLEARAAVWLEFAGFDEFASEPLGLAEAVAQGLLGFDLPPALGSDAQIQGT
jgi:hypothetical protein